IPPAVPGRAGPPAVRAEHGGSGGNADPSNWPAGIVHGDHILSSGAPRAVVAATARPHPSKGIVDKRRGRKHFEWQTVTERVSSAAVRAITSPTSPAAPAWWCTPSNRIPATAGTSPEITFRPANSRLNGPFALVTSHPAPVGRTRAEGSAPIPSFSEQ